MEHNTKQTESRIALSVEEACRMVGVGRTLLYEEIAAGHLKTIKIGRRRLIMIAALEAWLNSHEED